MKRPSLTRTICWNCGPHSRSFAIGERAIFSRSRHPYIQPMCGRLVQRQASELERRHCKYRCRSIE
jgi:hypothetical protein